MKTAVEWFFKYLFEKHGKFTLEEIEKDNPKLFDAYIQAKEIEKQQITKAYRDGKINQWENSEIYYSKKFNK